MIFAITHTEEQTTGTALDGLISEPEHWTWRLAREKDKAIGETIAVGVESYDSERSCRQGIAAAKKAMSGIRFAKTVVET
jgi:hypothetical protein